VDREIENFIIRQPPIGEKDDYDSENSWGSNQDNDDDCFYYHSWRNNVVIAFGTLSSFLT